MSTQAHKKVRRSPHHWSKSCLLKKPYTEGLADHLIKKANKKGDKLFKYSCQYCFNWHLTRSNKFNGVQNETR